MRSQNTNSGEFFRKEVYIKKNLRKITCNFSESETASTTTTTTTPSLHSLATKWWAEEAHEGSVVRNDENIRNIMRSAGWGFDEAILDDEGKVTQKEGTLLTNAKRAVEMLKQGGAKSEHWVL